MNLESQTKQNLHLKEPSAVHSNRLVALYKFLLLLIVSIYFLLLHTWKSLFLKTDKEFHVLGAEFANRWAKAILRSLGLEVEIRGKLPERALLLTTNHQSYLDIFVILALRPMIFVSKVEVETWPFIGILFRRSGQLTVDRANRQSIIKTNQEVEIRLMEGLPVNIFPEGKSYNGSKVLPFHSSLFQPAINTQVEIQPIAIRYYCENQDVNYEEVIAYWKEEHVFGNHFFRILGIPKLKAIVSLGFLIYPERLSRKEVSEKTHHKVQELYNQLLEEVDSV